MAQIGFLKAAQEYAVKNNKRVIIVYQEEGYEKVIEKILRELDSDFVKS